MRIEESNFERLVEKVANEIISRGFTVSIEGAGRIAHQVIALQLSRNISEKEAIKRIVDRKTNCQKWKDRIKEFRKKI